MLAVVAMMLLQQHPLKQKPLLQKLLLLTLPQKKLLQPNSKNTLTKPHPASYLKKICFFSYLISIIY